MFIDEQQEERKRGRKLTASERGSIAQVNLGNMAMTVVGIGVVLAIVLFVIMVLKNIWLMMSHFPLLYAALALTIVTFILVLGYSRFWLALIAAAVVGFLGFKGVGAVYDSGDRYYPSEYCGDYIRKLPDGSTPKFTTKRDGRGDELPALKPGQWVRVNGISYKEDQYNITTWEGVTGWVEGAAFPKDGAQWVFDRFGSGGTMLREIPKDRQVESYSKKYLESKNGGEMQPATLQQAIRVGAQTPFMELSRDEFKKTGDTLFVESGMTVTLERIVYAEGCTMIQISLTPKDNLYEYQSLGDTFETLQVKDLDTGKTFDVIPGNYRRAQWEDEGGKRHVVFMFWPFSSRRFSLTHTGYPQLDKHGGGFIGRLASIVSFGGEMETKYFTDWNFKEIKVR